MLLVFANLVFAVIYAWLVRFDCCYQSKHLVTSHPEPFMCSPSLVMSAPRLMPLIGQERPLKASDWS